MKVEQLYISPNETIKEVGEDKVDLVLVFGATVLIKSNKLYDRLRDAFPQAQILGCSTSGEILNTQVSDDTLSISKITFEKTKVEGFKIDIENADDSYKAGIYLGEKLNKPQLKHCFLLSKGLNVNGSDLVKGITKALPGNVNVTGGLAGDADKFEESYVMFNSAAKNTTIAALGFYGEDLQVGIGSLGGWDPFGPERLVTKSKGNVCYEFDFQPSLDLYKKYLGSHASGLPASGLLFPISLRFTDGSKGLVRTILSVNENEKSMTFAGDVPDGTYARLMKANFDRLIDGATEAARKSYEQIGNQIPDFAILISCVGRKLILKQRVEEEVEAVSEIFQHKTPLTGFYSYGEIAPFNSDGKCELHNQTMTITTFKES